MVLGGVAIQGVPPIVAHSDGDALCHAVTDAILGALALPDIGQLFPDTDPKYRGADSRTFLEAAVAQAASMGYRVVNVDATVILERPKLSGQKEAVRASLASMLGVEASRVNVKGKTHETLDALGRGEGVEVHAVVLMARG
jgi:2-C-methyl-D-erythritol 2,4-cyclodiphosphate synthase